MYRKLLVYIHNLITEVARKACSLDVCLMILGLGQLIGERGGGLRELMGLAWETAGWVKVMQLMLSGYAKSVVLTLCM